MILMEWLRQLLSRDIKCSEIAARKEGIGVEPASAASIAGLMKLVETGEVDKGEQVVSYCNRTPIKRP